MVVRPAVIIVGAGMSGLSAAVSLLRRGHTVCLLEARDRIGGRIHTLQKPVRVDAGASFVHGVRGNPLAIFAKEHDVVLSFPKEDHGSAFYTPEGPRLPQDVADKLSVRVFSTLFGTAREYSKNVGDPPLSTSLGDFLRSGESGLLEGLDEQEAGIVKGMVNMFSGWAGAELDNVSHRFWGFEREFLGDDGVVRDGYQQFLDILEAEIKKLGGEIRLSVEVTGIEQLENGNIVVKHRPSLVPTAATSTDEAAFVVCTLPLGVLKAIPDTFFSPPLPPRRQKSIERLGFGLLNKLILAYPRAFWPEDVAWFEFGSMAEDKNDPILKNALFAQSYTTIKSAPVLVFYFGADRGEDLEKEDAVSLEKRVRRKLGRHFDIPHEQLPEPELAVITRWRSDPYSRGAYSFLPVAERGKELDAATPLDFVEMSQTLWDERLGFAGEHTTQDHYACVHGPWLTGQQEAERIHLAIEALKEG